MLQLTLATLNDVTYVGPSLRSLPARLQVFAAALDGVAPTHSRSVEVATARTR